MASVAILSTILLLLPPGRAQDAAGAAPQANLPAADALEAAVLPDGVAAAARDARDTGGAGFRVVEFGRDLYMESDVMLQGIQAVETLTFPRPQTWALDGDPLLRLRFDHSAAAAAERSHLTVRINGAAIGAERLDADNVVDGELVVRIPRGLLKDYNELRMTAVQHINEECEDPFDPALWTRIRRDSTIEWDYTALPAQETLESFPLPLFDPLGYGPLELALVASGPLSEAQLDAIGRVGFVMGRHAAYRKVRMVEPVAELGMARTAALIVGTPAEAPIVTALLGDAPRAGEGMVGLVRNPTDPTLPVLVVAGGDAAGLRKAVLAVGGMDRADLLSGRVARVEAVDNAPPPASRQDPLPAPPRSAFTLEDLGIEDVTVRGYYAPPVTIPLRLEGDAHAQIEGARIGVDYSYAANLDTRLSTMEVRIGGITLRSVSLDDPAGEEKARLWVDLPFELVEPRANIEVVFHLFPNDFQSCVYVHDKQIWATVFGSTSIEVNRDHYAMLPDLTLLRHDLWPYGKGLEGSGVVVITADSPGPADAAAAAQVLAELGRTSVAPNPSFEVVVGAAGALAAHAAKQAIVLVGDGRNSTFDALAAAQQVSTDGDLERTLATAADTLLKATVGTPNGFIEQLISPANPDRTVLVLRAGDARTLAPLARAFQDEGLLLQMEGNAAVLSDAAGVKSIAVVDKKQIGVIPLRSQVQTFLRGSWGLLGIGVLIAAVLLAFVVRAWAALRGGQA
jgi:hypothetical protein